MYDPQIIEAAEAQSKIDGVPLQVIMKKAERYAKEIVPSFSPLAYFGFGTKVAKLISEFVYRVRLGFINDEKLRAIGPNSSVVFVMNHRSNMDYVLVTYLASTRTTLSYAVGEWARIRGLQGLIQAMGAYFIRRSSRNDLYRKVLSRYVSMATREGVTQAVFPEGGLSRDGKLQPLKLGLLSYMLSDYRQNDGRDIVFVPVGINYDRSLEDRILTSRIEHEATGRNFNVSISRSLKFIGTMLGRRLNGTLYRLGYACVSFGNPISMRDWLTRNKISFDGKSPEERNEVIGSLGKELLARVGDVIPVLPVSLVASVFIRNTDAELGELGIKSEVFELIEKLQKDGHHVHVPRADLDYAVGTGIRMLTMRHVLTVDEAGKHRLNPKEHVLCEYYANSIKHLLT
jgi:glycerol-3-phosphate O-acyltransferase